MKLDQLKMIVTGGAQGMGRHFAIRLAEAGAQVAVGDVNEAGLEALSAETKDLPGSVYTRRLDVAAEDDVISMGKRLVHDDVGEGDTDHEVGGQASKKPGPRS